MGKVINISDYKAKKEIEQIEIKLYKDGIKITAMYGHINIKFCKENSELIRKMSPRIRACSLKNISDKEFKSVLLSDMNRIASQKENNYLSNMEFISKCEIYYKKIKQILFFYNYDRIKLEVRYGSNYAESYWYKII